MGPDYCRTACGGVRCERCPAPTLLPGAVKPVSAYLLASTQWRQGPGGRTGLDYVAAMAVWAAWRRRLRLPADDRIHRDVAVIEGAILQADRERAEAQRAERPKAIGED